MKASKDELGKIMVTNAKKILSEKVLHIYTDGASRMNPGPSALAFIIVLDGESIHEYTEFLGVKTNNQAEYLAIIKALSEAKKMTNGVIKIYSDSEVVIKQLTGDYQVKNQHLRNLRNQIF
ncbi:MAG: ribonuclease HI family protein, partial [Candidatus Hodarchaeota archaeon]